MSKFDYMTDDYLKRYYVPDVYQKNIYDIDYDKLWDAGVRLLSYDIDDTITGAATPNPPKEAKELFAKLQEKGFKLVIVSNTWDSRAKNFAEKFVNADLKL